MNPPVQATFDFDQAPSGEDGVTEWHRQRERAVHRLARKLGLPLDHEVEVWLLNGMRLRGRLKLKETMLFLETVDPHSLELLIDRVDFRHADMESCVRLD
jgi:hypothetical protein